MTIKAIKNRIEEYFLAHPTARLRVRQIEREVGVPLPSAIRYTRELAEEGFLTETTIAGVRFFGADRSSRVFLLEKRSFNLRSLFESGLVEHLVAEYHNPTIIVFGSYAKGEDVESSDIDIYIETARRVTGLERFEKTLKRRVQVFAFKEIHSVPNKELANNIVNGTVLNGFIEVFR